MTSKFSRGAFRVPFSPLRDAHVALAGLLVVGAATVAWGPSLHSPFVFDDLPSVVFNPTIRELSRLDRVLLPRGLAGAGVAGRPVVNLTLALNYAAGGLTPFGYHLFNLALHGAAALLLLGCVRRTLLLPSLEASWHSRALPASATAALLWALHPLQTESVTCVIQRTELLFGFFLLLLLYCFVRSISATHPARWRAAAVLASALGMASKEAMVVAPVLLVLFDRQFVADELPGVWRHRGRFHLAIMSTWLVLGGALALAPAREGTVGFGLGVSSWHYALTQCEALVRYLALAFWPHPLVLDYGTSVRTSLADVLPQALLILALVGWAIQATWRRTAAGFLAAWFFGILAPSSSFVPLVTQTIAEHRMYLPLAALAVGAALIAIRFLDRHAVGLILPVVVALGVDTFLRNRDYESAERLWADTVKKAPANPRARYNLGNALVSRAAHAAAVVQYQEALRIYRVSGATPRQLSSVLLNLGAAELALGRPDAALTSIEAARACDPTAGDIAIHRAKALLALGRHAEAVAGLRTHLSTRADNAEALLLLADTLLDRNVFAEAAEEYLRYLRLRPDDPAAHSNLANAFIGDNRLPEAFPHIERAAELAPDNPSVATNLAVAHIARNRFAEGRALLEGVLRRNPEYRPASDLLEQLRQYEAGN